MRYSCPGKTPRRDNAPPGPPLLWTRETARSAEVLGLHCQPPHATPSHPPDGRLQPRDPSPGPGRAATPCEEGRGLRRTLDAALRRALSPRQPRAARCARGPGNKGHECGRRGAAENPQPEACCHVKAWPGVARYFFLKTQNGPTETLLRREAGPRAASRRPPCATYEGGE